MTDVDQPWTDGINESKSAATVLDRLVGAGLDPDKARRWLAEGAVQVDGVRVTDPATPCEVGASRPAINPN